MLDLKRLLHSFVPMFAVSASLPNLEHHAPRSQSTASAVLGYAMGTVRSSGGMSQEAYFEAAYGIVIQILSLHTGNFGRDSD